MAAAIITQCLQLGADCGSKGTDFRLLKIEQTRGIYRADSVVRNVTGSSLHKGSSAFFERLMGSQRVTEIPAFRGIRRFCTVYNGPQYAYPELHLTNAQTPTQFLAGPFQYYPALHTKTFITIFFLKFPQHKNFVTYVCNSPLSHACYVPHPSILLDFCL
jgi:hypothetical protein